MAAPCYGLPDGSAQLIGQMLVFRDKNGKLLRRCSVDETRLLIRLTDKLGKQFGHSDRDYQIGSSLKLAYGFVNYSLYFTAGGVRKLLLPVRVCDSLQIDLDLAG